MAMLFEVKHTLFPFFYMLLKEWMGVVVPVVGGGVGVVRTLSSPRFNSALRFDSSLLHLKKIFYQNIILFYANAL